MEEWQFAGWVKQKQKSPAPGGEVLVVLLFKVVKQVTASGNTQ